MAMKFAQATRKSNAMGPSVKNLLAHYQLDPTRITSSGPHQTLLKSDVLTYINQHNLSPKGSTGKPPEMKKQGAYVPNLDITGYQPKSGPENFSKIARKLLDM